MFHTRVQLLPQRAFLAPSSHTHDSIFELTFPLFYHVGSKTLGYSQITHNDSLAIGFAQHSVAHSHMFDGWSSHRFPPSSSPPTSFQYSSLKNNFSQVSR